MDLGQVTSLIVAVAGVVTAVGGVLLGRRGQRKDEHQQAAKIKLEERIASFDEMEKLVERLEAENKRLLDERDRLRSLVDEAEARGDLRLAQQGRRCRERLDDLIATISVLQGVVVSEMAASDAGDAIEDAVRHTAADHPANDEPDLD